MKGKILLIMMKMGKMMNTDELNLKDNPNLNDFQEYVKKMKILRDFKTNDKFYECCLLAEEVGELISAVRKNSKTGSIGSGSVVGNVKCELADVFLYLCSIANMHGIDLEEAVREKEEINKQRIWNRL